MVACVVRCGVVWHVASYLSILISSRLVRTFRFLSSVSLSSVLWMLVDVSSLLPKKRVQMIKRREKNTKVNQTLSSCGSFKDLHV